MSMTPSGLRHRIEFAASGLENTLYSKKPQGITTSAQNLEQLLNEAKANMAKKQAAKKQHAKAIEKQEAEARRQQQKQASSRKTYAALKTKAESISQARQKLFGPARHKYDIQFGRLIADLPKYCQGLILNVCNHPSGVNLEIISVARLTKKETKHLEQRSRYKLREITPDHSRKLAGQDPAYLSRHLLSLTYIASRR
ncbi:hypothetical protein [Terasakiella sp. SH-1]|uniref:hypothetical protein n=1 Tax=Terasakiella sp. SH-1 TaxID=2560057 RepID=UPI001074633B|nr:hypothetical protein [Terasakiella sp. SH-1]